MENIYHDNTNLNKASVAILILCTVNFRTKHITEIKKASLYNKVINWSKDIKILNIYAPNNSFKVCEAKTDKNL